MLETTRRRGATIALYIVFGILIAVFVLNFGPQSGGQQGCGTAGEQTTVEIGDNAYGMPTWRWAFNTRGAGTYGSRVTAALDGLVRRELLAQEAAARGLVVEDDLIDQRITTGDIWVLTEFVDGKSLYFEDGEFFNYKLLERTLVGRFGLTIGGFKAEQRRELLAQMMSTVLGSGARASRDEAYAQYQHVHNTVTADVVAFDVAAYKAKAIVTDADVDRWLAAHAAEAQAKYDADKAVAYTATPRRVKVRRVFVARTPVEPAPAPDGAAPADPAAPAPPPETKPDPAKAKLEAARAEIVAKKKTLADVARALDAEDAIRGKGGELGWLLPDAPGLGDPALGDALKAIADKPGEVSPVIETPRGYFLLVVEDAREGDLSFDQVKREIAAGLALDAWADEAARRAAIAALAEARAGTGKNLADLYEQAPAPRSPGIDQNQQLDLEDLIKNNPDLDPATIEQIRQMLEQQGQGQGKSGALQLESADVPAEWAQAGGETAPAPTTAAPTTAAPTAAAPPAATDIMTPSADVLPKFGDVAKAKVLRVGPMPRDKEQVGALGKSAELMTALFSLGDGNLADRVFKVETRLGTAYVIAQVITRAKPDPAEFEKQADELVRRLTEERSGELVTAWLKGRCTELQTAGKIKIHKDLLQERDEQGAVRAIAYDPCQGIQ